MNRVRGVGEHALRHVVGAQRVDQGLSFNRLPMEAQNAQENPQLLACATQTIVKLFHLYHHAFQVQAWNEMA